MQGLRFALLFLVLGTPLAYALDECASLPAPSVQVKRLEARVLMNFDHSYKTLNKLGAELARPQHQILGLTRGQAVVRYELKITRLVDPSGRWECASPQIVVSYGFNPITVYVAREFPQGSCAYKEIYDHEVRHLEAYRQHAEKMEKDVAAALTQRFASGSPWRGPVGQAQERLQQELSERWVPYMTMMLNQVEPEQARIDSREEYERIASSCNDEIKQRLIR